MQDLAIQYLGGSLHMYPKKFNYFLDLGHGLQIPRGIILTMQ